jgi:hypothetical protein
MISYGLDFLLFCLGIMVLTGTAILVVQAVREMRQPPPKLNLCDECSRQLEEYKKPTLEQPL